MATASEKTRIVSGSQACRSFWFLQGGLIDASRK
jgi:hypothetical protein